MFAVRLIRNIWRGALGLDLLSRSAGSVGFIGEEDCTFSKTRQKQIGPVDIMSLTRGQHQFDWQTTGVGEGMNFRGQSPSRAPHTMNSVVFFTLAAC